MKMKHIIKAVKNTATVLGAVVTVTKAVGGLLTDVAQLAGD